MKSRIFKSKISLVIAVFLAALLFASGCGTSSEKSDAAPVKTTIKIITHGSFALSEEVIQALEDEENIKLEILEAEDTGSLVAQVILSKNNPVADVAVGIDNTFIQRALTEDVFIAYEPPSLLNVNSEFKLSPLVTPISYGDVCLNYWLENFATGEASAENPLPPKTLNDLTDPAYKNKFVTENPETSSPGLAFMLATIAKYGEDGWLDYWRELRQNGLSVTSGWNEAYYGEFIAGGGERPIVTSYASSPVAEVFYSEEPLDASPTGVVLDGCFRQVEYAGILKGTDKESQAKKVLDWLLSESVQEDIPLQNFVYPVNENAKLPQVFIDHSPIVENPLSLPPAVIAEKRDEWTAKWVNIVLR